MSNHCDWRAGAELFGPEGLQDAVSRAYERATKGNDLALDGSDCGLPIGVRFGAPFSGPRLITRTAGSTGKPRRVIRTQASWTASFAVMAARFGITPEDRYGILGDLSHSLSFYALAEALHLGASASPSSGSTPQMMSRALQDHEVTLLYATPTQLRVLDMAGAMAPLGSVRALIIGGGPFDGAAARAAERLFPEARLELFYGASETSFLTLGPASTTGAAFPFPGVELQIRRPDGEQCLPGETGEVWVGGPYLAAGYAKDKCPVTDGPRCDGAGRITLGERGRHLPDGTVSLLGRGAEMITVGDRNVFPAAVEAWLLAQDGIGHAAVLPRPDALRGQRLEAAICWRGGDLSGLRADLRRALGAEATPARLVALEDWPLLPSGKTDLAQLRTMLGLA